MREIIIENARENNLKNVSLRIPHYQLIAVTGVSGSGKTSLVHDVLCAEGQRLFFENFFNGRFQSAKLGRPKASRIEGLFPVMAVDQNNVVRNPRSTVGTLTGLYDLLRLLFARLGQSDQEDIHPNRSLFSFNLPDGWCPTCKGLGVQDHIDPSLLIGDPTKTIREGAFVLTTPNNYIIYSQVTMEVLDQVCRAEGFNVDIPWQDLSEAQKNVVLYGSTKIKVLFGKHPLESRLKWTGITAKPREEDYYKGIVPVMEDILKRDRNPNIMRYARSYTCKTCNGKRLNETALSVKLWGKDIAGFTEMTIKQTASFFSTLNLSGHELLITQPVRDLILKRTNLLQKLGAGHLTLNRESMTLSGGEGQRIRLANQVSANLRHVLYILDEPSVGLHPVEIEKLAEVFHALVSNGNTVVLVDHDEQMIREADWIVDIGPGAGNEGGSILFNGPADDFFNQTPSNSKTWDYLVHKKQEIHKPQAIDNPSFFHIEQANKNNLQNISPRFLFNAFNVITGVSGSGKTSLVDSLLEHTYTQRLGGTDRFKKIILIDSSPIGRTPKSNPATYTGMSDHIRDLMAALPESKKRGYKKGQFSFVVKGGRCESCEGAGVQQIGMHFLGNVEIPCETCNGKRFTEETLEIKFKEHSIYDILELTVDEAGRLLNEYPKIKAITDILSELGLGYLKLGQASTTLSGGEAQRVKLAYELSRSGNQTLYILDEPTTGLHPVDVEILLKALHKLIVKGHTLLCIEHDPTFILQSNHVVDLGPGSADEGGMLVFEGSVDELLRHQSSLTALELRKFLKREASPRKQMHVPCKQEIIDAPVQLLGVETNNLKHIDCSFQLDAVTAVTGVSGSGKSSLVFGTLHAESSSLLLEGMPAYNKQFVSKKGTPVLRECRGLIPTIALQKKNAIKNPRSTIATYTGLYDVYRLLFSRLAKSEHHSKPLLSSAFSFNNEEGACPICKGLGYLTVCNPDKLVICPEKPIIAGAMDSHKTGRFYGDVNGQYVATLSAVAQKYKIDLSIPYQDLDPKAKEIAMNGCGQEIFDVEWNYKRGNHQGVHRLKTGWPGFLHLVETEYLRKHTDDRGEAMLDLIDHTECNNCKGFRLKPDLLEFTIRGMHIGQITRLSADDALLWFHSFFNGTSESEREMQVAESFRENIFTRLNALNKAGLGYISTDRIVGTLSGGEFQRLQLAGSLRAPLTGIAYILDEPAFGLHPKDTERIGELIMDLNRSGNTVILSDHSPILIEKAHQLIEIGPGSGNAGGQIIYTGSVKDYFKTNPDNRLVTKNNSLPGAGLSILKAHANNLKNIDVEIPSGVMTALTGVSGSGKTSLLDRVIYESFITKKAKNCQSVSGFDRFEGLIYMEQALPAATYNSSVGTKLGVSEAIARLFASLEMSKTLGYKTSFFMSGARDASCPLCEGTGHNKMSMDFFNDVVSPCEACGGTGFRDKVLEVMVDGKTVFDIHQMPLTDLCAFLESRFPQHTGHTLTPIFDLIQKTGLGHLSSGRLLKTLSGGELQRLKLVSGLAGKKSENNLILLDEPTGGLHPKDIGRLLKLFNELIESGNTILCVTHEPLLIASAYKTIELGPGGGTKGGEIVGE